MLGQLAEIGTYHKKLCPHFAISTLSALVECQDLDTKLPILTCTEKWWCLTHVEKISNVGSAINSTRKTWVLSLLPETIIKVKIKRIIVEYCPFLLKLCSLSNPFD